MAVAPASSTCQAFSPLRPPSTSMTGSRPRASQQASQRADLGQHFGQELLAAKPWIDRHDQHDAAEVEHIFDHLERRRRVQHDACGLPELANLPEGSVQMDRRARLAMNQQMIRAGLGKVLHVTLGLDDHQVHVDRLCRRPPHGLDDDRSDCQVGNKAPVHDIDMDPVGPRRVDGANLLGEPAEIGR